jgi:hypothetical protein
MQGAWSNETEGVDNASLRDTIKTAPLTALPEGFTLSSCCPSDYCWDGVTCVEDMSESGNVTLIVGQYLRCAEGSWVEPITRYDWYNDKLGFCKGEDQCFVDSDGTVANDDKPENFIGLGNPQNPRCVANGQFIEDHYCDNGNWTSRTKFIATQLLNISGDTSSFTLYCDSYDKIFWDPITERVTLSETQETLIRGNDYSLITYFGGYPQVEQEIYSCFSDEEYDAHGYITPCVNNLCRLDYNTDGLVFGMSVNKPINFSLDIPGLINPQSFLYELFGVISSYCDSIGPDQDFSKCEDNPIFWYSGKLNSIIRSKTGQPINFEPSIWDGIVNFFVGLFGGAPTDTLITSIDFSFLNQTKDFNRICISKQGVKKAYMVAELPKPSMYYITAKYENIAEDMCHNIELREFSGERRCTQEGNNYTIYVGINISQNVEGGAEIDALWGDLVYSCLSLS